MAIRATITFAKADEGLEPRTTFYSRGGNPEGQAVSFRAMKAVKERYPGTDWATAYFRENLCCHLTRDHQAWLDTTYRYTFHPDENRLVVKAKTPEGWRTTFTGTLEEFLVKYPA